MGITKLNVITKSLANRASSLRVGALLVLVFLFAFALCVVGCSEDKSTDTPQISQEELAQYYIDDNLLSRVTRRYSLIGFATEEQAQQALNALEGLEGQELADKFAEFSLDKDSGATTLELGENGDVGWDLWVDLEEIEQSLNQIMLSEGTISPDVYYKNDKYWIVLCTGYYAFSGDNADFSRIQDTDLRQALIDSAVMLYDAELVDGSSEMEGANAA